MSRRAPYTTEAIVLRGFRYGEADRILHLQTRDRGRVAAIAKGVRKTASRLAGRLEPLSRVDIQLVEGSGEVQSIRGADLLASGDAIRADGDRLAIALHGTEVVVRLFPEAEPNDRLFDGLVRFLDACAARSPRRVDPAHDPLALAFAAKLVALAGFRPRLDACAICARPVHLDRYDPTAGGLVCADHHVGFEFEREDVIALDRLLRLSLEELADDPPVAGRVARAIHETIELHVGGPMRSV